MFLHALNNSKPVYSYGGLPEITHVTIILPYLNKRIFNLPLLHVCVCIYKPVVRRKKKKQEIKKKGLWEIELSCRDVGGD